MKFRWIFFRYSVVATSSDGGLIETVPDAISLDTLKKRIPNAKTLEDYFISVSSYTPLEIPQTEIFWI